MRENFMVRGAEAGDMPTVATIFGGYVERTVITFEVEPPSIRAWQQRLDDLRAAGWPFLVGELDNEVIGYAYVAAWRSKPAYRFTVENTVYLAPEHTGRGYGRRLLDRLLRAAAQAGARQVIAVIADSDEDASVALHRAAGFTKAGRLHAVGHKHGRWVDVTLMQVSFPAPT